FQKTRGRGGALIMAFLSNIPRCQHIKVNGTQCGSPALKRNRFCYFHNEWREAATRRAKSKAGAKPESLIRQFPVLEDANSIQVGLMHVMRLLVSGEMDSKTAGLLLYALQTASFNLRHTNFEPSFTHDVVIHPSRVNETPLGGMLWSEADFEEEEEEEGDAEEGDAEEGDAEE